MLNIAEIEDRLATVYPGPMAKDMQALLTEVKFLRGCLEWIEHHTDAACVGDRTRSTHVPSGVALVARAMSEVRGA